MATWMQNLLVLLLVAGCLAVVGWQIFSTLFGGKGRMGSCCAKGCASQQPSAPQNSPAGVERVVFFPAELLGRKR